MVFFILFYKKGCRNSFILFKQGDILIQIQENSDVLKQKKNYLAMNVLFLDLLAQTK